MSLLKVIFLSSVLYAASSEDLLPFYSLALVEGHKNFKCEGTLSYSPLGKPLSKPMAATLECKAPASALPKRCFIELKDQPTAYDEKTIKLLKGTFVEVAQSFTDMYMSRERAGAFAKARKVSSGWEVQTPENGILSVNNDMSELKMAPRENLQKTYGLSKMNGYLVASSSDIKVPGAKITSDYEYQSVEKRIYPKSMESKIESPTGTLKLSMQLKSCTSN